jgi:2,3-bisphosphoglycerate-independent phosphoglycerate mutase
MKKKPVMLCILDGWGMKTGLPGDALSLAKLPNFDRISAENPMTTLKASGLDVGLPAGLMGNSEVGHLNIGAGRVVYQDLTAIDKAIADGDFYKNEALLAAVKAAAVGTGRLHLMGLLSDGGVHSHFEHLLALLRLARENGVRETYVHCFMDGRDVPPTSGIEYLERLLAHFAETGYGKPGVVCGRFYAMDRDKRWERVERAWRALVLGEGKQVTDVAAAVRESYAAGVTDEFIEPIVPILADGSAALQDGDSLIFYNFRADRAREITRALTEPDFADFSREKFPKLHYCCMTEYDQTFDLSVAFLRRPPEQTFGEVIAGAGLRQLRIAETEKYAHVTFFFNGGVETPNPGEERILVPSPKVATYDLQPEMSATEVCEKVVAAIRSGEFDAIILNLANPDMVGHTGVIPAAVKAVETVDGCLGEIEAAILEVGGAMLVTADHGNVERLLDEEGNPVTAHTTSPVPLIMVNYPGKLASGGALCDLAPTLLEMLELEQPAVMTGHSLIIT